MRVFILFIKLMFMYDSTVTAKQQVYDRLDRQNCMLLEQDLLSKMQLLLPFSLIL
jgi:hypothetical protein